MTTSNYMPEVKVEVAFNSGYSTPAASRTWTDVSDYVELADKITIGHGRSDEFSTADANTLELAFDNSDGRFTALKASSPYYPNVKIGRPIRVTATPPGNRVTNSTFEVDAASWESNSAFGFYALAAWARSVVRFNSGVASLLATWPTTAGATWVDIPVTGLTIGNTYTASAYVYVPVGSPDPKMEVAFTATGTSTSTKAGWTRLSVTFVATSTQHFVGVRVDASTAGQQCWIDDVMLTQGPDLLAFDSTLAVASTRFLGYVDEWPVAWNGTAYYAKAQIKAHSRIARLGTNAELRATLIEESLLTTALAYYPLDDASGASSAVALAPSTAPALTFGGTGTAPDFAGGLGPFFIDCVQFNAGQDLRNYSFSPGSVITVIEAWISPTTTGTYVFISGSNGMIFYIDVVGGVAVANYEDDKIAGGVLQSTGSIVMTDGFSRHVAAVVTFGGASTTLDLYVNGTVDGTDTTATLAKQGIASRIRLGSAGATGGVANVMLSNDTAGLAGRVFAGLGYIGDTATQRIIRYAGYAGIASAEVIGDAGTSTIYPIDSAGKTAIAAMRVVEETEAGVLFDDRSNNLTFHGRARRLNAASSFTLDASLQQVESELSPKMDRSTLVNDITATAWDGSSSRAMNTTSIADHGYARKTIELATDVATALSAAYWQVNLYGDPRPRIVDVPVDVVQFSTAMQALLFAADISTKFTISNLPTQAPSTSATYFIEGYTEEIGPVSYSLTFNVSPTTGFDSFTLDDATNGTLDTTYNTLAF